MTKTAPYQALPKGLYVMNSPIAGQGIFTMHEISSGTELGMSHIVVDKEISLKRLDCRCLMTGIYFLMQFTQYIYTTL